MIRLHRPPCPNPTKLKHDYKNPENKAALREACHDKCMYCESKIPHIYYGDVEHIKPKAKFPELENAWDNLGYVCAQCNGHKGDKWSEEHPFVNPFDENPAQFLVPLGAVVRQRRGSERGEYSWREIALNRPALIQQRHDRIEQLSNLIDKVERTGSQAIKKAVFTELADFVGEHSPYSMVTKAALSTLEADHQPTASDRTA